MENKSIKITRQRKNICKKTCISKKGRIFAGDKITILGRLPDIQGFFCACAFCGTNFCNVYPCAPVVMAGAVYPKMVTCQQERHVIFYYQFIMTSYNESHEAAINPHRETATIEVEIISNTEGRVQFEDVLVELFKRYMIEVNDRVATMELLTEIIYVIATHKLKEKGGCHEC